MIMMLLLPLIGWPGILSSLLISVLGLVTRRSILLVVGALLSLGFAWYLRAMPSPIFKLVGYALPLTHLLGALLVELKRSWGGWPLLLPHASAAAYLAAMVLSQ